MNFAEYVVKSSVQLLVQLVQLQELLAHLLRLSDGELDLGSLSSYVS